MNSNHTIRNIQIIKAIVIVSGIILIFAGIVMIFMDMQSEGEISIITPIIEGNITTTHIGLFLIFFGIILELCAIIKTYQFKKKRIIIEGPDISIKEELEEGMCRPVNNGD